MELNRVFDMTGKVVMVTGASSGFGEHFAKVFAAAGAKVAVAARRVERLEKLVDELQATGAEAVAVKMDVTDEGSIVAAYDAAEEAVGPVDVLINNAGVAVSKTFLATEEDDWDFTQNTNLKGVWRVAQEAARRMVAKGIAGSIVNVSSMLGFAVERGHSAYAVSKAGVVSLSKSMACELVKKNIRVNTLCPGYFETEMNTDYFQSEAGKAYVAGLPAGRLGQLDELTGPVLLLASDAGSFMNGEALLVDGGQLVRSL